MLDSVSLRLLLCVDIVVTVALLLMSVASILMSESEALLLMSVASILMSVANILMSIANILVLAVASVVVLGIVARGLVSITNIGVHAGMTLNTMSLVLLTRLQESLDVLDIVLVERWLWSISMESVSGGDNDINISTKTVTLV